MFSGSLFTATNIAGYLKHCRSSMARQANIAASLFQFTKNMLRLSL
ncbi:hypothetical protein EIKCOROL_01927 [Eikenella corrodens ATCC 23834]|uniref:Uncharacterized protein n=1 Tax=Eikenella corrodens ATCC 23834 TaxID=546274 RepID=C0DX24_EIKCO|nr:hypothetical protein EIKCOROL_01927 [Eikenella corrodens ATCC 23834]